MKEVWLTLQIGEKEVYRNYIVGEGSKIENIADIDWQEQVEDMADSLNAELAVEGVKV